MDVLAGEFEKKINDPGASLAIDFDPQHGTLLICFSGPRGELGCPLF